jgi:hypothetical protein
MNIFKKVYQNSKNNHEYLQKKQGTLRWWFYMALGSAFVATRICAMLEDSIHWPLFWKSFIAMFGMVVVLRWLIKKIN